MCLLVQKGMSFKLQQWTEKAAVTVHEIDDIIEKILFSSEQ